MIPRQILRIVLLLIFPIVIYFLLDPAATASAESIFRSFSWAVFFLDLPIGMCLLHYYFPQLFRGCKRGHYSIVPWGIFFLVCWGIVALEMFLETRFGRYPENGFSAGCAYFFGWAYIWFTMIPVGLIYLLFRLIQKLCRKSGKQ